ncbi:MAG: alpha/beta fold hydrolase, partial [Nevskiales bacterium]
MPILTLDTQDIHYRDAGHGPPLILLHANPGDSRDYDSIVDELARFFRVLRVDWPGYGGSPAPEPPELAGASLYLKVLTGFIEKLDLTRVHFIGNSVGGNAATRYALNAPHRVASLVLVSSGGFTRHNAVTRAFCRFQGWPGSKPLLGTAFTRLYLSVRNEWTRAMIARAGSDQATPVARRVNAAVWRSFLEPEHNLLERARALQVPTLVVSGRRDPVIPAAKDGRYAAAAIPGARQVVLDCG